MEQNGTPEAKRRYRALAYRFPGAADRLRANGTPCLAKMTEVLTSMNAMSSALAVGNNTLLRWLNGEDAPAGRHEAIARRYLEGPVPAAALAPAPAPVTTAAPAPEPAPEPAPAPGIVLLVTAPIGTENKVCGVLRMLGCETQIL